MNVRTKDVFLHKLLTIMFDTWMIYIIDYNYDHSAKRVRKHASTCVYLYEKTVNGLYSSRKFENM